MKHSTFRLHGVVTHGFHLMADQTKKHGRSLLKMIILSGFLQLCNLTGIAQVSKADQLYQKANSCYNKGAKDSAIIFLTNAISLKPNFAQAFLVRGAIFYQKRKYREALKDFTRVIEINPDCSEAYNDRGIIYEEIGNYDQAIMDYNRSIEIDPGIYNSYYNRGRIYFQRKDWQEAIRDFERALKINPGNKDIQINLENAVYNQKLTGF
jgi:tetratricopeptide (TPR) repeat protein